MRFFFAGILRKHNVPYFLIRSDNGDYDRLGEWKPPEPSRTVCYGHFQPLDAKLQQSEGGRYTSKDKALFTSATHQNGDVIEYQGEQYTVDDEDDERAYSDIHKYILKLKSATPKEGEVPDDSV
ncbi:hypothetical protein [Paenibacillus macerans]|uniref:hypothetical protein n=1 Tax=Paenibacillus macerans TaxID=44252 RepID=UPI003D31B59C